ncbi:MAG: hypothetical protein KA743_05565 [Geothrix sp.]|uniref:Uncharacterized protein n=1 Tax=Candidatus Geothrix odensensis TaxID=2954440 RepID=A0A936K5D0_9BACT|nr:hypothetical protein [Candidatus Geothrix odensensis]MBP7617957.1 hypothetical protein [Geothrix sp.]MCC6513513.1 hypothetical protein [Geothrix sp.]
MSLLRLLLLLLLQTTLVAATRVESYTIKLQALQEGGGRAVATVALVGCTPGSLVLPLGFPSPEGLRLEESPAGVKLALGPRNGMTSLHFMFPEGMPTQASLRFSFAVKEVFQVVQLAPGEKSLLPKGSRLFRHAFVNTQEALIGTYRLEFLFPEGLMAQAIREQLPKPKKSEVMPRVLLSKSAGFQAAVLQFSDLRQGDDTSMTLELVPNRRSLGWLWAGLLMAGLYLFKFRDLIAKKGPVPAP